jgi:hypothetical protein
MKILNADMTEWHLSQIPIPASYTGVLATWKQNIKFDERERLSKYIPNHK